MNPERQRENESHESESQSAKNSANSTLGNGAEKQLNRQTASNADQTELKYRSPANVGAADSLKK